MCFGLGGSGAAGAPPAVASAAATRTPHLTLAATLPATPLLVAASRARVYPAAYSPCILFTSSRKGGLAAWDVCAKPLAPALVAQLDPAIATCVEGQDMHATAAASGALAVVDVCRARLMVVPVAPLGTAAPAQASRGRVGGVWTLRSTWQVDLLTTSGAAGLHVVWYQPTGTEQLYLVVSNPGRVWEEPQGRWSPVGTRVPDGIVVVPYPQKTGAVTLTAAGIAGTEGLTLVAGGFVLLGGFRGDTLAVVSLAHPLAPVVVSRVTAASYVQLVGAALPVSSQVAGTTRSVLALWGAPTGGVAVVDTNSSTGATTVVASTLSPATARANRVHFAPLAPCPLAVVPLELAGGALAVVDLGTDDSQRCGDSASVALVHELGFGDNTTLYDAAVVVPTAATEARHGDSGPVYVYVPATNGIMQVFTLSLEVAAEKG